MYQIPVPEITSLCQHISLPVHAEQLLQVQRLFHGRGRAYPGLHHVTVDWLPPVLLITLFAPETDQAIHKLAAQLHERVPQCETVKVQHRYISTGPMEVLFGQPVRELVVQEAGLKYKLQLGKNRNLGLFLDMRNGRQFVRKHAQDKRVLNLFAYTCGFSVAAIAGGAQSVFNIDMSRSALNSGRDNHQLNQQSLDKVRFDKLDIFKSFSRIKKHGPYDVLICDPPTLQKGSVDIARDYPKIIRRLAEFMAPRSSLLLCLNAPQLSEQFLLDMVEEHAPDYPFAYAIKPPEVFVDAQDKGLKTLFFTNDD